MISKGKIGYACTPISLPYRTSRSIILKNFNQESFEGCVRDNLKDLMKILYWNKTNGIDMFRVSSDIIPFGSHAINDIKWWETFAGELYECGRFIRDSNMRISMHPGQYTVLNSPREETAEKSIKDLEYHCRFLDAMGLDYSNKIILHVGGVYGDKLNALEGFKLNFKKLSGSMKKRLVIENDDKSYTIEEVLGLCTELGVPAVFDNLHHKLNPCDLEWEEILNRVKRTWKEGDGPVKFHYSDQDVLKKGGAHSKSVITKNFVKYMDSLKNVDADIMLEVKDKEVSAIKCLAALSEDLPISKRTEQWAKYKYNLMEKNYSYYKKCSAMINSETPMLEIYEYIDECLESPFSEGNFVNAALHVYGYVKETVTQREKENFNDLLNNPSDNKDKIKDYLQKLCKKYSADYVNDSYYFIY